ncbi:MAG: DUF6067 family protein [Chloroflexi bacterium]|nr:DUF6067 family protein [Chloroflexota bacterium]
MAVQTKAQSKEWDSATLIRSVKPALATWVIGQILKRKRLILFILAMGFIVGLLTGTVPALQQGYRVAPVTPVLQPQNSVVSNPALAQPAFQVWVADAMTRIGRQAPAKPKQAVYLRAARNEYEAFQVVVAAHGQKLTNGRAQISDFRGKSTIIDHQYATLYREHYVQVKTPSPLSPMDADWIPDALIPFADPETGAELAGPVYTAEPFTVEAGYNQPLWVDVFVPAHTAAGTYTATLTVTAEPGLRVDVPITLKVWNFTLPKTSYQHSSFGLSPEQLRWHYDLDPEQQAAAYNILLQRYSLMLIQHRLMPANLPATGYAVDKTTGQVSFPAYKIAGLGVTPSTNLHDYLVLKGVNDVQIPLSPRAPFADALGSQRTQAKRYLGTLAQAYQQQGGDKLIYVYPIDEPENAAAYQAVRDWAALVHEANQEYGVDIKLLLTEQPEAERAAWGSLVGAVDIWVPCCGKAWHDLEAPDGQRLLAERLAQHEAVWWYTALVQPSNEWLAQQGWPDVLTAHYPPVWLLDYPPINFRISAWLNRQYGFTGLLYWNTNQWKAAGDVWTNPATYLADEHWFNGEGLLIYPGDRATIGFDGPVASMRLKWLRESMEDYDYIELLKTAGQAAYAQQQVAEIARSMDDWAMDPSALYTVRQNLGERLSALPPAPPANTRP